jgi:hypothetical protein
MTPEQLDYFSDQTRKAVKKAVRNYARGALLGFLVLLLSIVYVLGVQRHDANEANRAVVQSGQVVSVDGCNRDYHTIGRLRSLFLRLEDAARESYQKGRVTKEQADQAVDFYEAERRRLVLPDCRQSKNVLTYDPEQNQQRIPTPLHP